MENLKKEIDWIEISLCLIGLSMLGVMLIWNYLFDWDQFIVLLKIITFAFVISLPLSIFLHLFLFPKLKANSDYRIIKKISAIKILQKELWLSGEISTVIHCPREWVQSVMEEKELE